MKATQQLHNLGQSLWLDNITRDLLDAGTLKQYIDDLSVTGLTSNPTIFNHAIKNSAAYDGPIRKKLLKNLSGEELFFDVALEDLTRAADMIDASSSASLASGFTSSSVRNSCSLACATSPRKSSSR